MQELRVRLRKFVFGLIEGHLLAAPNSLALITAIFVSRFRISSIALLKKKHF